MLASSSGASEKLLTPTEEVTLLGPTPYNLETRRTLPKNVNFASYFYLQLAPKPLEILLQKTCNTFDEK